MVTTSFTRRHFIRATAVITAALTSGALADSNKRRPVILDTDIGDDIDDTWALFMLLRMPELDLKLAVGDFGNAIYRARLLAKLLDITGRTDVPVGIGMDHTDEPGQQSGWIGDYQLRDYPGHVHTDGVQAIIDTIKSSPEPVTLICLGPVPNIAEALRRDPSIASNAKIVGMYGSIYKGYLDSPVPAAEYNVRIDPQSLQAVFAAPWECTITPLDTCGLVVLDGDNYRRLYLSEDPWLQTLMENYRVWLPGAPFVDPNQDTTRISTTLFDTVAVYLAVSEDLVDMQTLPLRVTDDGYTVIDAFNGRPVRCAIGWKDLEAYERQLVETLLG
ncbi:MAG: nucleoside hydrolase [Pseudomonadaceae bacterium]|nr:nucleoside hydrolase [Pseudomonadaceae bacterium]